jgi:hypothetical protein
MPALISWFSKDVTSESNFKGCTVLTHLQKDGQRSALKR